ncbi:hypothetical protein G7K71_02935 [Desulfofundulus sp. TPOSR]|uniref:hypothetical protein n=1 Tax=Desulfofundulus sp. TPOSR TaxID=2714340 RepID=UPI001407928E|nr:hypothetical protein [Desulfofundulus sp. TPOSR]NHM25982.1 hypothetical protein [Desulfofundulus sp. TPOSR]
MQRMIFAYAGPVRGLLPALGRELGIEPKPVKRTRRVQLQQKRYWRKPKNSKILH